MLDIRLALVVPRGIHCPPRRLHLPLGIASLHTLTSFLLFLISLYLISFYFYVNIFDFFDLQ